MIRAAAPAWLKRRMQELNVNGSPPRFGTDRSWKEVENKNGKFVGFIPFSKFDMGYFEYHNTAHIDKWGGRSTANPAEKKDAVLVPVMGDSISFGVGVEDAQSYVSLLDAVSKFRYINLGVPGSSLINHLDIIEFRHKELGSPGVYVFNFFINNDLNDNIGYYIGENAYNQKPNSNLPDYLTWINHQLYSNPILKKSYLLQFIKVIALNIYNKYSGQILRDPVFLVIDAKNSGYLTEADQYLERTVERLERLSKDLNFKAVFILIPDRCQVYPALLKLKAAYYGLKTQDLDVELPNRMVKNRLRAYNIPCIDILECLRQKGKGLYYVQDNHLTVAGNKAVFECIYPQLEAILSGLLSQRSQN
jgi:hypothetical protein